MLNPICDVAIVRKAIDCYPKKDIWGSELFFIPITQLEKEFGITFNVTLLELMYDNLGITRKGLPTTLNGIVNHALRQHKYDEAEQQSVKTPLQIKIESGDHWYQPTWEPAWSYTKCLLRIFQSDPRTRVKFEGMVSDDMLGI